ncbi:MAG: hypothetical protein JRH18_23235 [Deltaproteobacteria bacterium]|nr:hypothetical protein [Deltaproteobacteria bacterium]MBW1962521.1 hypothetical protein [Deltaproteobacteria bacterium]MBW2154561.1 hypothetical protein [Deltaproteobacteria bacterium]
MCPTFNQGGDHVGRKKNWVAEWGDPDVVELECTDKANAVTIELRRIKE